MRIKVTSYTHPENWYANKVGGVFGSAQLARNGGYTLFDKKHYFYHVNKNDCVVVEPKHSKCKEERKENILRMEKGCCCDKIHRSLQIF